MNNWNGRKIIAILFLSVLIATSFTWILTKTYGIEVKNKELIKVDDASIQSLSILDFEERISFDIESTDKFYLLICPRKGKEIYAYSSENLRSWKYIGVALRVLKPYKYLKRPVALYANGTYHLWVAGKGNGYRDTLYFSSPLSFINMSYNGVAIRHYASRERRLEKAAIITDAWFDETESKFHAFVGGGQLSDGRWNFIFHAESDKLPKFKLDTEPLKIMDRGKWAHAHIYPPQGEWINDTYHGIIIGCSLLRKPYNHIAKLVTIDSSYDLINIKNLDVGNAYDGTVLSHNERLYAFLLRYDNNLIKIDIGEVISNND